MVEKILLSLILFVVSIVRRPSSRDGRELDRDTRSVKHLKRVSDLGKKEPGLAMVRPDDGFVGDNGSVGIQREFMTAAAILIMAAKL